MNLIGEKFGAYILKEELGIGGFGTVYKAEHEFLTGRVDAIKILNSPNISHQEIQAFINEAKIVAQLVHPNIVQIKDFMKRADGIYFLIMPLYPSSLQKQYSSRRPMDKKNVGNIIKQVASALQHTHDHNIIHLDVKPDNILLGKNNKAVLSDFGIATFKNKNTHFAKGTYPYMAPEVWRYNPLVSSDQYALAIIAYQLLTGELPFKGPNIQDYKQQHLSIPPTHLQQWGLSQAIDIVIQKALEKDPGQRYPRIQEFAQSLELAINTTSRSPQHPVNPTLMPPTQPLVQLPPTIVAQPIRIPTLHVPTLPPPQTPIVRKPSQRGIKPRKVQSHRFIGRTAPIIMIVMLLIIGGSYIYSTAFTSTQYIQATPIAGIQRNDAATAFAASTKIAEKATVRALASTTALARADTHATALAQAKAADLAPLIASNPDPYPPYNQKLVLFDPLTNNQSGYQWQEMDGTAGSCHFVDDAYHMIGAQHYENWCSAQATNFSDFTYEVQMTFVQEDYLVSGGILFRNGALGSGGYIFEVFGDGRLYCRAVGGYNLGPVNAVTDALHRGLGQTNLIAVVAKGNSFSLYVNGQLVMGGPVTEFNNYGTNGMIGVFVTGGDDNVGEVTFRNARVWL